MGVTLSPGTAMGLMSPPVPPAKLHRARTSTIVGILGGAGAGAPLGVTSSPQRLAPAVNTVDALRPSSRHNSENTEPGMLATIRKKLPQRTSKPSRSVTKLADNSTAHISFSPAATEKSREPYSPAPSAGSTHDPTHLLSDPSFQSPHTAGRQGRAQDAYPEGDGMHLHGGLVQGARQLFNRVAETFGVVGRRGERMGARGDDSSDSAMPPGVFLGVAKVK